MNRMRSNKNVTSTGYFVKFKPNSKQVLNLGFFSLVKFIYDDILTCHNGKRRGVNNEAKDLFTVCHFIKVSKDSEIYP